MQGVEAAAELQLHSEEQGTGEPILFIHGFGVSSYTWRHLAGPLSGDHRVILVDLKGFGGSPKPPDGKYSVYDQADLVEDFIVRRDLNDLTLVGSSFGGAVALVTATRLAEKAPHRLKRLILIDSVGYPQRFPPFISFLRMPVLGPLWLKVFPAQAMVRGSLELSFHDVSKVPEDAVRKYGAVAAMPGAQHALVQTARQIMPRDTKSLTDAYSGIEVPTLILWGRHDRIVPLGVGRRLNRAIPNSRLEIIEACGHLPQEERPKQTLIRIERFLEETARRVDPRE